MPDPEKGSFYTPGPKGPSVQVGEEFTFRLTPFSQLLLRVQCLEKAIACSPFAYRTYDQELERVGLKKLDVKL